MNVKRIYVWVFLTGFFLLVSAAAMAQVKQQPLTASAIRSQFKNPPAIASPWVFWYWHQAAISRQGITADLEAMKKSRHWRRLPHAHQRTGGAAAHGLLSGTIDA